MKQKMHQIFVCLLDMGIVAFSFFMVAWYRTGTRVIIREYSRSFLAFLTIWIVVSLLSSKYHLSKKSKKREILFSTIKTNFTALSTIFILIFFFRLFIYSRFIVFGTVLLTTLLELVIFISIHYMFKFREANRPFATQVLVTKSAKLEESTGTFFNKPVTGEDNKPYSPTFAESSLSETVMLKLWQKYLDHYPLLFDYISEKLNLTKFSEKAVLTINSATYFNIEYIDQQSQQMFINLHPINDFRRINLYFIKVNENLMDGGVFVCCAETIAQRRNRFLRNFGKVFGRVYYFLDFLFRRVSPKIPIIQGIYFALTKGRDRSLSETEILGRLYYCGFKLIGYKEIDDKFYFIVRKASEASRDERPSYGPVIRLKRVGVGGQLFHYYKFRTMHPYSEYLQEYIHSINSVTESGKFADDFRITSWGGILRKYWIDELPQFINLFKGDLRLIGTRALSVHYLSQYPEDLKELRSKWKPGLIPVYTADGATNLIELIRSERTYLQSRLKSPFATDLKYLSKALFNILTRRVKSLDCYK